MTELCGLATKYGTDKIFYTPFYSMLLEAKRGMVSRMMEIGVGTPEAMKHVPGYKPGASLRMWRDYFPFAHIFGIDKDPSVQFFTDERIHTGCADQRNPSALIECARNKMFDLIVDDGSHAAEDQLIALKTLLPYCRDLYIIEDADVKGGLLERLEMPYSYVQVKTTLTGHCVVIRGKY